MNISMAAPSVDALKEQGNRAFNSGRFEAAIELYSQALEMCEISDDVACHMDVLYSNRWAKALYRSAVALRGLHKPAQALQILQEAHSIDPDNAQIKLLMAGVSGDLAAGDAANLTAVATPPGPGFDASQLLPKELREGAAFQASPDGTNTNLILLLHGLGDTAAPFAGLARKMALPQTDSLALQGPLAIPGLDVGRAWFTAFEEDGELIQGQPGEQRRVRSLEAAVQLLCTLVDRAAAAGWPTQRLHLFGFSQGGSVCLEVARRYSGARVLGGCAVVSASLLPEALQEGRLPAPGAGSQAQRCPLLITHGDRDDVVSREDVERSLAVLQSEGHAVELVALPGKGHAMVGSEREMRSLMAFWGRTLATRPTGPGTEGLVEVQTH